jgi:hypothetical protein
MDKFAEWEKKYLFAGSITLPDVKFPIPKMEDIDASIKNQISSLYNLVNTFNILRICADSGARITSDIDVKAIQGFQFIRHIVGIIDYLKASSEITLSEVRRGLEDLLQSIKHNYQSNNFSNVTELIFHILPHKTQRDREIREQEYAKAKKGLSRIVSLTLTIINQMNKLGGKIEEHGRFEGDVARLSPAEVNKFILNYGNEYLINNLQDWYKVFNSDSDLEKPLTTLVHALLQGKTPKHSEKLKLIIKNILRGT